jgi:hypothetical protein
MFYENGCGSKFASIFSGGSATWKARIEISRNPGFLYIYNCFIPIISVTVGRRSLK